MTRLLRSEAVREVLYNCYLFLQAAFGVVDVIEDHSSAMTRATHLASKRTAFRDAQAALLEEGDAQSGAQVLMSVLLAKPSGLRTAALVTGHTMERIVIVGLADGRANGRAFVPHLGQLGKMFTNSHTGNTGGYGVELAAVFERRVFLNIPHILMARAATQEDHDHALLALSSRTGFGLGLKQLRQGQPAHGERPDFKKIPAAQSVAMKAGLVCVNF